MKIVKMLFLLRWRPHSYGFIWIKRRKPIASICTVTYQIHWRNTMSEHDTTLNTILGDANVDLLLCRFLKHLMMTNNTLTMGSDFTIVLLCNAYSTNPDYFTRPMAALFETINKTPVGAAQPTVPLPMVTLDSLTVHAKMSLIHRFDKNVGILYDETTSRCSLN